MSLDISDSNNDRHVLQRSALLGVLQQLDGCMNIYYTFKSMALVVIFICCLVGFSNVEAQSAPDADEIYREQQTMISNLAGNVALADNSFLKSRATSLERERTRKYLSDQLASISLKCVEHAYRMPNHHALQDLLIGPFVGVNIYAILPATSPSNEYVIIGAHYDTSLDCPGANDNASGMALVYSVTKLLNSIESRNKNVILVFFDQEEEDLVGSKAFVKWLAKKNFSVHSVHTVDQMGWDEDGDRAIELELPTPNLESLYKKHGKLLGVQVHVTKVNSTDHQSFRAAGYQATGITEEYANKDTSPYKDTSADTFETVNFNYLASSTMLVYHVIKEIITK